MATSKALATISNYAALAGDTSDLKVALAENIGDDVLSEFDIDRVRVPTGGSTTWEVPSLNGEVSTKELEGIILAWFNRRAYWSGPYAGGNEPPQCSSLDGKLGVGTPGGECASCPFAQFGSSDKEESPNAQACTHVRQLFILTPDAMLPTVLTLPPTSLKSVRSYMFKLSSAAVPHTGVITKFTLEKATSNTGFTYAKVVFAVGEQLLPDARAKVIEYAETLMPSFERVAVTRDDVTAEDGDNDFRRVTWLHMPIVSDS